jgi:GR25 family glycosyltransferase involved in LPS biosynthesis
MLNLFRRNDTSIEAAYIITVRGNENSEKYSQRCQQSCIEVGMPFKVWDAYNGINPGEIIPPPHLVGDRMMSMMKITDHYLTRGEVACALSHISLWEHCAAIDKPIVILEHDALMAKKFEVMDSYNTIVYLGGNEWKNQGWNIYPIPPHASEGPNYFFICRAHAYAIDPAMAKNLLSHVLKFGICAPLDIMMRADVFTITHQGMYAYDNSIDKLDTTILKRPMEGRTTKRNDKLEW